MRIGLIAAVARNGVIGKDGALAWHLPDDLARFKRLTLGKPVLMGRKTHESIGRPLPGRTNLVLSRTARALPGCTVVRSVEEALAAVAGSEELWVIGGEAVYAATMPCADVLELTLVETEVEGDAHFPDFERASWSISAEERHPADARHAHSFRFVTYVRMRA